MSSPPRMVRVINGRKNLIHDVAMGRHLRSWKNQHNDLFRVLHNLLITFVQFLDARTRPEDLQACYGICYMIPSNRRLTRRER